MTTGWLRDKVVLITGGSRGIGEACALACARAGAHVALAGKTVDPHPRLEGTLGQVADGVRALGREALVVPTDVRFEEQVQRMVDTTVGHFGRVDALINNAGAIYWAQLADWPVSKYDLVNGVNVRATFLCSRAVIPHLRERGGHILMMSPPINPKGAIGKAPYFISKIGMTLIAQAIDAEEPNIHACALWPVTAIKTAATMNFGMGEEKDWRKPEILSDATRMLLDRDPAEMSFRAWLDEEVLAENGVTDLAQYRCLPDSEPPPMSIALVDPDWSRGA